MFSTPKKVITKYRAHPVLGSPLKWLGLFTEGLEDASPNLSSSSSPYQPVPATPSPTSSPILPPPRQRPNIFPQFQAPSPRPLYPTDTAIEHTRPTRIPAPFKLGKHRSQAGRQKSIRIRRAPNLKRSPSAKLFTVEKEVNDLLADGNAETTPADAIFMRETAKMAHRQHFHETLEHARQVASNAVNLEEVSAQKRAKERARRAVAAAKLKRASSGIWSGNYRERYPQRGYARPGRVPDTGRKRVDPDRNHRQFLQEPAQVKGRREAEQRKEAERRREQELRVQQEEQGRLREQQRLEEEARMHEQRRLQMELQARERERVRQATFEEAIRRAELEHLDIEAMIVERRRHWGQEDTEQFSRQLHEAQARREAAQALLAEEARQRRVEEEMRRFAEEARSRPRDYWTRPEPEPMDVDPVEPADPSPLLTRQLPSIETLFVENERKWNLLTSDHVQDVRLSDLPWPIFNPERALTADDIFEFIKHPLRPGFQGKNLKARVKVDILRWHPDKFMQKHLKKIHVEDRETVLEAVNHIARILIDFSAQL